MNIKTRAIVLHKIPWKESSYITTLMTDKFGIIKAIAQGAKKPKSKFFSLFEIGNILEIVLIQKETSSLSKIIDACLQYSIQQNEATHTYEQLLSLQITLEIYTQLLITEDEAELLFNLLASFIYFLPTVTSNHLLVNWRLMIKLAEYLGFPLVLLKNNNYQLTDPIEIKNKNSQTTLNNIDKWLQILPYTSQYIKQKNILDPSASEMNIFIFDWYNTHLQKKIQTNALSLYEEYFTNNFNTNALKEEIG